MALWPQVDVIGKVDDHGDGRAYKGSIIAKIRMRSRKVQHMMVMMVTKMEKMGWRRVQLVLSPEKKRLAQSPVGPHTKRVDVPEWR